MRKVLTLLAILLPGCMADVRGVRLAAVDLSDMKTVQEISRRLPPAERPAFATFVVMHRTSSPDFCGSPLAGADGDAPATVGEAIQLTLAREAAQRAGALLSARVNPPQDPVLDEWADLIARRDLLLDGQAVLRARHGPEAERLPRWRAIDASLAAINRKLAAARPRYRAAVGG